jgi:hypothetical protein
VVYTSRPGAHKRQPAKTLPAGLIELVPDQRRCRVEQGEVGSTLASGNLGLRLCKSQVDREAYKCAVRCVLPVCPRRSSSPCSGWSGRHPPKRVGLDESTQTGVLSIS